MRRQIETVRSLYSAIGAGDVNVAAGLISDEADWVDVHPWAQPDRKDFELLSAFIAQTLAERYGNCWSFELKGRGPKQIIQYVLLPFIEEGSTFSPSPTEFRAEGEKVVWLGSLTIFMTPRANEQTRLSLMSGR